MLKYAPISQEFLSNCMQNAGGFAWWYADLADAEGRALVLVWSWGLPFLPESRKGRRAQSRPALHLGLYEGEECRLYLLQEYAEERTSPASLDQGTMGKSRFRLFQTERSIQLHVELDEKIPGSEQRVQGFVRVTGTGRPHHRAVSDPTHRWSPLALYAQGHAQLTIGKEPYFLSGSAYLDSNASLVPLHDQEIASWRWGRVSFAHHTLVYYWVERSDCSSRCLLLCQGSSGELREVVGDLKFLEQRRGAYGVRYESRVRLRTDRAEYDLFLGHPVEDGPFYQRFIVRGTRRDRQGNGCSLDQGRGVAEVVVPPRIDLAWQRPFVRMKTHRIDGTNSVWLPLFSGPTEGRAERLAQSLMSWGRP